MVIIQLKKSHINITEYDLLRVVLTLFVVIAHCTYFRILTPYGGCDYTAFTLPQISTFYRLASRITAVIYTFHMPLYMALSGALYRLKNSVGGYVSCKYLMIDKLKKLLIPFFAVTLLYSVPLKYISGYYSTSDNIIRDIFVGQVLIQGNTHLWFLPTLFFVFIIVYLIERYVKMSSSLILFVLFAVSFISIIIPIEILKHIMEYTFWFYVGYCFENTREQVNKRVEKSLGLLLMGIIVFVMAVVISRMIPELQSIDIYDIIERIISYISALSGCFSIYVFCFVMSKTSIKEKRVFKFIRKYSFGLYLYSDTWNYIILCVTAGLVGNLAFITNCGSILFYFCRIIITFIVALVVSMFLRKLNVKYIC